MNFTMKKANIPYGKIIRQEIQLILDPKQKTYLPWISVKSLSGGMNNRKLFFAKWEGDESYKRSKMIQNLPINQNFKALLRSYADLGGEQFVTFDCLLNELNTKSWYCKSKQVIRSDEVCNTKEDCWDASDEDPMLCRGSNNNLVQISKCVNITLLVLGYIVSASYYSFATSKIRCSEVDAETIPMYATKPFADIDTETFNVLFEVCKKFQVWNNSHVGQGPRTEDFVKIIERYKFFHEAATRDKKCRVQLLMMKRCIRNLSLSDSFRYTCMEITDCLISLEQIELHSHEDATAANRCIKKILAGDWIVSNFVIQSKARVRLNQIVC